MDLADVLADLLMIDLRDGRFYDEDHEFAEFKLAARLFVRVVEF